MAQTINHSLLRQIEESRITVKNWPQWIKDGTQVLQTTVPEVRQRGNYGLEESKSVPSRDATKNHELEGGIPD